MSDDNQGLSDDEYDALLSDLEGRAESGGDSPDVDIDEELGDLDEILASAESEGEVESSAGPASGGEADDDLESEFAALESQGEPAPPPQTDQKDKSKPKDQQAKASEHGDDEKPSRGKRIAIAAGRSVLWFAPAVVLAWVLGAYLANWVSAGWLIALGSVAFVCGLPALLKRWFKRGSYRPWLLGSSLVLLVALMAPMPQVAGTNLAYYGHWPASVVAEVTGADGDATFVRSKASVAGSVGGWIARTNDEQWEPRQLGTVFPLGMEWSDDQLGTLLEDGAVEPAEFEEAMEAVQQQAGSEDDEDAQGPEGDESAVEVP